MAEDPTAINRLENIRSRIDRGNIVRSLLGKQETPDDRLMNAMIQRPTKIARSEILADDISKEALKKKTQQIRDWVLKNGKIMTEEYLTEEEKETDKGRVLWGFEKDDFHIMVDKNPSPSGRAYSDGYAGYFLSFVVLDKEWEILSLTTFDGSYNLEIDFKQDKKVKSRYRSGKRGLDEGLTDDECKILSSYMDEFATRFINPPVQK